MICRALLTCVAGQSLVLFSASCAAEDSPRDPALARCSAIADPSLRLGCYDQLARDQGLTAPATSVPGPPQAPVVSAPRETAVERPSTSPAAAAVTAAGSSASQATTAQPASDAQLAAQRAQFGLYSAEHAPAAPKAKSMSATVTALGGDPTGHPTVTLEGNQLWELDGVDPLLAVGQPVKISRAMLGSFILTTASGRSYRARRLH